MQHLLDRITLDPEVRSGKPVIRGTRITVSDILEYLAGGMSQAEILVTSLPRCHASPSRMRPPAELKASPFPRSKPPVGAALAATKLKLPRRHRLLP